MSTLSTKLIDGIKSKINHKITNLQIDDLFDYGVIDKHFNPELFSEFLKEDLIEQEEEESSFLRFLELFKRDMLLSFTNTSLGKDIPSLATNHVYDKFCNENYNTMHTEFHTRLAKTTSYLISIFLNVAKTPIEKDEVMQILMKLKNDLSVDPTAEQKFFILFSLVNNLIKLITDKNYNEFFSSVDFYTEKMKTFVKDSPFTIYLMRENFIELSNMIVTHLINTNLNYKFKKMSIIAIFKLGACFKLLDLHLEFIDQAIKHEFDYNFGQIFSELIEEVFVYTFGNDYSKPDRNAMEKFTVAKEYGSDFGYVVESSYATDGRYIYVHQKEKGLFKIGTGKNNTIQAKVYMKNDKFKIESNGSLAYTCGKLYYRAPETKPYPFACVDPNSLKEIPIPFEDGQEKCHFVDRETKPAEVPYPLQGHQLIDPKRSNIMSRIISEGRFIYLISKIGALKVIDNANEGIYPGSCLFHVDIFDPLCKCAYVTSFPLTDPKGILSSNKDSSSFICESIINDIVTDGNILLFLNPSAHVTYNLISRCFTHIVASETNNFRNILDPYNSSMTSLRGNDSSQLEIMSTKLPVNIFQKDLVGGYSLFNTFIPCNIKTHEMFPLCKSMRMIKGKEKELYDRFFCGNIMSVDQKSHEKGYDNITNISLLLSILSQGCKKELNFSEFNTSFPLSHVFCFHILDFSSKSISKLYSVYKVFMDQFMKNHSVENRAFILSSLLSLFNAHLHQLVLLQFNKFTNFETDFSFLKNVVEDSIFFTNELYTMGRHYKGLTIDLISQSFQIVENYSSLFEIQYPNMSVFLNLLTKELPCFTDLKHSAMIAISKCPQIFSIDDNIKILCEILEMLLQRNDNILIEQIDKIALSAPEMIQAGHIEYEKEYEGLLKPFLKIMFDAYYRISNNCQDDVNREKNICEFQKLMNQFEHVMKMLFTHMKKLFIAVEDCIHRAKIVDMKNYERISQLLQETFDQSSYTYRLFYSSILVIQIMSKDKFVIYKTWHYFIDLLFTLDKSFQANQKEYFDLIEKDEKERFTNADLTTNLEKLDWVIETPHPIKQNVEVHLKSQFKRPYDIHIEFDPLVIKKDSELKIVCKADIGQVTETFSSGFVNKTLKNVTEIEVTYNGYPSNSYGMKGHIHNGRKYTHIFNKILSAATSIIINSIKAFFFFNYSKNETRDKDVEEMLQSKLFSGGIDELLDLQSFSEEFQNFFGMLKESGNYCLFEKKLSTFGEISGDLERVPFEIEEIISKENISVEKFIEYAQIVLKPKYVWINIGGEKAGSIVRGAFSVVIKQEKLYDTICEVSGKIIDMEEASQGKKLTVKELSQIDNFEHLVLIWSEVSRLRQWYQEQIKDLAESKKKDFDKQNEDFVNSVIEKCKFLFQINPQKSAVKRKTVKMNSLEFLAKSQKLFANKIQNDILKTNIIKFKQNLLQGKSEQENSDIELIKKNSQSVVNCIKTTKISIEVLKTALRNINTKAKFREVALCLINSILKEVETSEIKLSIVKQIIQTLRMTSGKRIVNIDDEITSASPLILNLITLRFHEFIKLIFGGLLSSESVFNITSFMDCLLWNYKARDHKVLGEAGIFENLFIYSPNKIIKEAWNLISKLKIKSPYKKSTVKTDYSKNLLCSNMLELFQIISTTVAARVIDETHASSEFNQQVSGFVRRKSCIFDSSFEKIVEKISYIIQQRLEDYVEHYMSLIKNISTYQKEFLAKENHSDQFQSEYFNETFLTVFLLLIYKFNINHSPHIMKYMKNPEFLSSLLILLRFTSTKNKLPLVNILKVYLNDLSDEDIENLSIFLKKKDLMKRSSSNAKFYSKDIEAIPARKFICLYLLESLYLLRKGIHEKSSLTLSHEYEEGVHLINLLRFMYEDCKWSPILDAVFIEHVGNFSYTKESPEAFASVSQILSVLNGDFDDIHYGSKVLLKYKSDYSKTITEKFKDKMNELDACASGYVLGFCGENIKIGDLKSNREIKEFIYDKLHSKRISNENYVFLIIFEKDSYSKNKLKSNDVEFQTKNIQDIILCPEIDFIITNQKLIECLVSKFNDVLSIISNTENQTLYELYMFNQIAKTINSIFSVNSQEITDYLHKNISLDKLQPLIEQISDEKYICIKSNQMMFMNQLKFYLDRKSTIGFELHDKIECEGNRVSISCEGLRTLRQLRIYRGSAYNGKVLHILASNITVDSDSFSQLNMLKVCKYGDSTRQNFKNCLLLADLESNEVCDNLAKISDVNFCVLVSKKDLGCAKDKISHPYIVVSNEFNELDTIITHLETKPKEPITNVKTLESLDPSIARIITNIRKQTVPIEETKITYAPAKLINPQEIIQAEQANNTEKPVIVRKKDFQKIIQRLTKNYIRFFVIHIISDHPEVINTNNFCFISKQFKIAYLDACGISNLTIFSYKKFCFLMNLLSKMIEKEEEIQPQEKLINIHLKSNIFNSYNFNITEADICRNVQTELVDFTYENELVKQANNMSIDIYIQMIMNMAKISLITINYESQTFIQYLDKIQELISKFFSFIIANSSHTSQEKIEGIIKKLRVEALDKLVIYLCDSISEEKSSSSDISIRTKKLLNFCYEYSRMYTEMYKKAWNVYKGILFDDLPQSSKLADLLYQINLLYYKTKYPELKDRLLFQSPDIQSKLTSEFSVPYCEATIELTLNYKNSKILKIAPKMNESRGKTLIVAKLKENAQYDIGEMIEDIDLSSLVLYPGNKLLIANTDSIQHELWMCGYNEKFRLGNNTLTEYSTYYAPIQSMIDKNIKIRKVVNLPSATVVISTEGNVFVAGEGTNSGVTTQQKIFSLDNKWNSIAKKDQVVDFASNDNSGTIMVTQKGVWVSGYNSSSCFGDACSSGSSTSDIIKWNISVFTAKKIVEVALGYCHCIFRLDDGSLYGTGCNNESDFGLPTQTTIATPTKIPLEGATCLKVSCGYHSSLFIIKERDGSQRLYSSGYNCYGQNGQGTSSDYKYKKCMGVEDLQFKFAKIGYYSCCAITTDSKLYTWGYCGYSNLAQPDNSNRYQPTLSEFFSNKVVLEADINERNLAVKAIESDGTVKLWTSGYNGSGLMSIGESNSSYYNTPMEVTAFKDAFVYKFFLNGLPVAISFVKSNADFLKNPFEFKCDLCSLNSSSTLILHENKSICIECFKSKEDVKVTFGIRGYRLKDIPNSLALPDLTEINKLHMRNPHSISCYECNHIISKGLAYIVADTLASKMIAFCATCFPISCYFDVPRIIYLVKYEMDYSILPNLANSLELLGYNTNNKVLKLSKFQYLNEDGKKVLFQECPELMTKVNKEYDGIHSEYIIEYIKLLESNNNDRQKMTEEIKKNKQVMHLTEGQVKIIEELVTMLDCSLKDVRKYVYMDVDNAVKEIYITSLPFMGKASRIELFEKIIYEDSNDVSPGNFYLNLSRGKAYKFKQKSQIDYQGNYTLFGQAFQQLKKIPLSQCQGRKNNRMFTVQLVGEGATDAGGPYREIMNIMMEELQSSWIDLFIPTPNNKQSCGQDREKWTMNPSAKSNTHLEMYSVLGRLMGFAVRSLGFLTLNLPSFVWKQILDQPLDVNDLEKIDIHTANFLMDLMSLQSKGIDKKQFEECYDQTLTTVLSNGKEVEVQAGGFSEKLTYENAQEYARLSLKTRFEEAKVQIEALKTGLLYEYHHINISIVRLLKKILL